MDLLGGLPQPSGRGPSAMEERNRRRHPGLRQVCRIHRHRVPAQLQLLAGGPVRHRLPQAHRACDPGPRRLGHPDVRAGRPHRMVSQPESRRVSIQLRRQVHDRHHELLLRCPGAAADAAGVDQLLPREAAGVPQPRRGRRDVAAAGVRREGPVVLEGVQRAAQEGRGVGCEGEAGRPGLASRRRGDRGLDLLAAPRPQLQPAPATGGTAGRVCEGVAPKVEPGAQAAAYRLRQPYRAHPDGRLRVDCAGGCRGVQSRRAASAVHQGGAAEHAAAGAERGPGSAGASPGRKELGAGGTRERGARQLAASDGDEQRAGAADCSQPGDHSRAHDRHPVSARQRAVA
mmetsp:Transcript_23573/g.60509  ORF Transcript_23573/g.60509 Transcript_23573/m.60509 type:complete len:344 (+) Transcript_23573:1025-2056(+)